MFQTSEFNAISIPFSLEQSQLTRTQFQHPPFNYQSYSELTWFEILWYCGALVFFRSVNKPPTRMWNTRTNRPLRNASSCSRGWVINTASPCPRHSLIDVLRQLLPLLLRVGRSVACWEWDRPRVWVMPTSAQMWVFDIQREGSLSWI